MNKEYYNDRNKLEYDSIIKSVVDDDKYYKIVLENTIFFPGGGGQPGDRGKFIYEGDIIPIKYLEEDGDDVVHILDKDKCTKPMFAGEKVRCMVDRLNRMDSMSQHSGQHLLSGVIYELYGRNTKGLHIGNKITQLDIDGEFDDSMVEKIETIANNLIAKNIKVKNYILSKDEFSKVETRRPLPDTDKDIRILEIEGVDINACCGVHVNELKDIGLIKIKKYYKHKDGTRFEYLAGKRAIDYLLDNDRKFDRILKDFNSNADTIGNAIENLKKKKDEIYEERKEVLSNFSSLYLDIVDKELDKQEVKSEAYNIINMKFPNMKPWLIKELVGNIVENRDLIIVTSYMDEDKYFLLAQCSKDLIKKYDEINIAKEYKNINEGFNVRGGGSKFMLQIQSDNEKDIDILLNKIYYVYIGKINDRKGGLPISF